MARSIHYPPGTALGGGKTVVQLLHAAGLRAVYKIRDAEGRLLAIKVFHHTDELPMAQWDRGCRRLVHEYEVLSRLGGLPLFPVALDVGMLQGDALMLMELLEGRTLPRFLAEGPTVGRAMEALLDGGKALAVLHDQGVRHRDIKPGNLFIPTAGPAVLLDLGTCQTHLSEPITGPEEFIGTPPYVSPEYAADVLNNRRDKRRASPREDIYSLGVCLYELLAGTRPTRTPPSAPPEQLLEEIASVRPPHPCDVQPEAKALAPLGDLAMRWMDKEPRNRPAMGLDAVRELEEALARCGDVLERPLPARRGEGKIISIGWARRVYPVSVELHSTLSEPANTPAPAKSAIRARRRAMRRWGASAAVVMVAAALMMLSFALVVLALKVSGWTRSGDGTAQTNGHRQGDINEAGKAPEKPPPPTQDQKRPPCEQKYEVEMEGGCWQRSPAKACAAGAGFKVNGKCYIPVLPDSGPPVAEP